MRQFFASQAQRAPKKPTRTAIAKSNASAKAGGNVSDKPIVKASGRVIEKPNVKTIGTAVGKAGQSKQPAPQRRDGALSAAALGNIEELVR